MVNFSHAYPYRGGNCNCFLSHIARWLPIANKYTLFCPLILDHGVLLKISASGPKVLISNFLFDTSFHHSFQSVIIRSLLLLMSLQVVQFQSGSSRLSPSGSRGAPGGEHLSIRVRSYRDQLHGPIRFPRHLSVSTITDGNAQAGAAAHFPPLRWPDCTLSRLRAEEYDRPVTQSTATPEPSSRTIPTLDRTLVAR